MIRGTMEGLRAHNQEPQDHSESAASYEAVVRYLYRLATFRRPDISFPEIALHTEAERCLKALQDPSKSVTERMTLLAEKQRGLVLFVKDGGFHPRANALASQLSDSLEQALEHLQRLQDTSET